ncbi:MAG: hypothetical protein L0Z70_15120 [Chloroflexi bacterium]|nr:hypothetical protein [Chloroflexota bacterium]
MDKKTTGIIATIVAVLLCGCPGLFLLCFGAFFATVGQIPGAEVDVFNSSDPGSAMGFGLGMVCLGLLLALIPVAVGFFTLRRKPAPAVEVITPDEPLPPVS